MEGLSQPRKSRFAQARTAAPWYTDWGKIPAFLSIQLTQLSSHIPYQALQFSCSLIFHSVLVVYPRHPSILVAHPRHPSILVLHSVHPRIILVAHPRHPSILVLHSVHPRSILVLHPVHPSILVLHPVHLRSILVHHHLHPSITFCTPSATVSAPALMTSNSI